MESTFDPNVNQNQDGAISLFSRPVQLRINEPFCYDRDMLDVRRGEVVYPQEMRLDWTQPTVVAAGYILSLNEDLTVLKVH